MALSFDRLLSMGAFDGLRSIRNQAVASPALSRSQVVDLIRTLDPDGRSLDLEAALELEAHVALDASVSEPHVFYRLCILGVFNSHHPDWARTLKLGRGRFLANLSRDVHHCFRSARLIDVPLTMDVVEWWDILASEVRHSQNLTTLLRARRAERMSLNIEAERLAKLGIDRVPEWIAIDNNTVGFDILSYDRGPTGPISRLVEVKSTITSPLRFRVSRNEWKRAIRATEAYVFHFWDLTPDPPRLHERTVAEVGIHIPSDNGKGEWADADVPLG